MKSTFFLRCLTNSPKYLGILGAASISVAGGLKNLEVNADEQLAKSQTTTPSVKTLTTDDSTTSKNNKKASDSTQECVIVVGTTGSGKSSTIAKFTGNTDIQVSSRPDSVTRFCEIFKDLKTGDPAPVWIDTVGYDDSNAAMDDKESFQEVLKFIDANDLRSVRAIVWNVTSQERKDARLQRQAEFINLFKVKAQFRCSTKEITIQFGDVQKEKKAEEGEDDEEENEP